MLGVVITISVKNILLIKFQLDESFSTDRTDAARTIGRFADKHLWDIVGKAYDHDLRGFSFACLADRIAPPLDYVLNL